MRAIEEELDNLMRDPPENSEEKRSPSREDFDRISRVTTASPITVNHQGSMGRKTIESLKEIERNRQLHLAKQGKHVQTAFGKLKPTFFRFLRVTGLGKRQSLPYF